MKTFWLLRSNIKECEYYHKYKTLEIFKKNCHDYYMLFPLWMLKQNYVNKVIIWRLTKELKNDIVFNIGNKKYIQRWVWDFKELYKYSPPTMTLFRGGFPEYDEITRTRSDHFGKKLYLGAGQRIFPQWHGIYDAFLIEDERDFVKNKNCIPFYKTASPYIFHPLDYKKKEWDICWPCNFTQIKYKGQKTFISLIAEHPSLQKLKIVHCGNKPEVGRMLCKNAGINNIEFMGSVERKELNEILNRSKFGLNLSNMNDGCPRVSTEILMSGTPLILRNTVRLLNYFRQDGVIETNIYNLVENIKLAMENYNKLKKEVMKIIKNKISFTIVTKKNIELWKNIDSSHLSLSDSYSKRSLES